MPPADYIKQAVEADNAGELQKAFDLYKIALEYFSTHLKYEKNPRARDAITAKVYVLCNTACWLAIRSHNLPMFAPVLHHHPPPQFKEYLERAEYLKSIIDGQQPVTNAPANGANAAQKSRPGGGGGGGKDDDNEKLRSTLGSAIVAEKPNVKVRGDEL